MTAPAMPEPSRGDRWQLLRAGVVNLWEFDVAEYWLADGRAQFVGQNQSGKSTLMALTSLILLAGDLDRQLVDTFGQEHKAFRYYVEPTGDPQDRRESGPATSRGWAWLEFARRGDDGPRYFTCLLFAQARRGATDLDRTWAVCDGQARVRAGLDLHQAAAVRPPSQLAAVPGFRMARTGTEYRSWVARDLFGFTDPDRLDAVVRMLKVLRTPHLGQRLDPSFFTAQMRIALPAIEPAQVEHLAQGWDALDALARDRDQARTARDAVAGYLAQAWNPWADATLRGRADQLTTALAGLDEADQAVAEAGQAVTVAQDRVAQTTAQLGTARDTLTRVEQGYEDLLTAPADGGNAGPAAQMEQLQQVAARSRRAADDLAAEARKSQTTLDRRAAERQAAIETAARATDRVAAATRAAAAAAETAGLPAEAVAWAAKGESARLDAAIRQQRQQVADARPLLAAAARARQQEEAAARWATQATAAQGRCAARSGQAAAAVDAALQALSDELEGWAAALGEDAPPPAQRTGWLQAVSEQCAQSEPQPVLAGLLRMVWLTPQTAALRERSAVHEYRAGERQHQARERDDQAAQQLLAEPEAAAPGRYLRRQRPPAGPDGTPLWRLLEPREGLTSQTLTHIEAALDAAGLLDAWVTPDGTWLPARDGRDTVLTAATGWPDTTASFSTLASVLQPAPDAGPLASRVGALLHAIGYLAEENRAPLSYAYGVTSDGRWHTPFTAGQAGVPEHGPGLIGAATRRDARDRRVQALRDETAALREEAAGLRRAAALLRERLTDLETAAARAPGDVALVRAVLARQAADAELRRAEAARDRADDELGQARAAAQDAHTVLLGSAVLPGHPGLSSQLGAPGPGVTDTAGLDERAGALQAAGATIAELAVAQAEQHAARQAEERARALYTEAAQLAAEAGERASRALRHADRDQDVADNAEETLDLSGRELRQAAREQRSHRDELTAALDELQAEHGRRLAAAAAAGVRLATAQFRQAEASQTRDAALAAWWIPVDAGLAAARGLPAAPGRTPADAAVQAQAARQLIHPPVRPGTDPEAQIAAAWAAVVGRPLVDLRTVLEAAGGRGVALLDPAGPGQLPGVEILADGTGLTSEPAQAVAQLDQQIATLTEQHDQTVDQVLAGLLSSTFVEHLQDRQAAVTELIEGVNQVLAQHPTGASATTLRLRRQAAAGHETAFAVLTALESPAAEPPARPPDEARDQVRTFLEQQIRAAQDQGRAGAADWRQHLAVLLDYRRWFDVVTDYRVGEGSWRPFTEEVHAKDSGGGKAVTLLQPMLAALVALYREPGTAPRPLWLDEAFTGVDDANRATMLALLVTFDLDFLLAGPTTLITTAQVPSAAVWFINRAPAPDPGVDLSLLLWSGDAPAAEEPLQNNLSETSSVPRMAS
jgi:hypothetical protein